jgi:hypothetical protein
LHLSPIIEPVLHFNHLLISVRLSFPYNINRIIKSYKIKMGVSISKSNAYS